MADRYVVHTMYAKSRDELEDARLGTIYKARQVRKKVGKFAQEFIDLSIAGN